MNKFPLYVSYEEERTTIQDTFVDYTGFREDNCKYTITAVSTVQPKSYYYERVVLTAPQLPETVHVVLVRYSTGGTFSRTNGVGAIEGAYTTFEEASAVKDSIQNNTYAEYKPWEGYFERLEAVEICEFAIMGVD